MSASNWLFDKKIYDYICSVTLKEHPVLVELRKATQNLEMSVMQIAPEQGHFMAWFLQLIGAKHTIEVGTFTGYSTLATALALPEDGSVIACDVSKEWTDMARTYWSKAGVAHKIDLKLAPAMQTLSALLEQGRAGQYDFAFIDADKENYQNYYEACLSLLKTGGVIAIDNVLWSGKVADENAKDGATLAIKKLNAFIATDKRVSPCLLSLSDGLMLARKI